MLIHCFKDAFTAPLHSNERGADNRKHRSSTVARVRFRANMFAEPLSSNELFRLLGVMSQYRTLEMFKCMGPIIFVRVFLWIRSWQDTYCIYLVKAIIEKGYICNAALGYVSHVQGCKFENPILGELLTTFL
jgi:hypothetical protein